MLRLRLRLRLLGVVARGRWPTQVEESRVVLCEFLFGMFAGGRRRVDGKRVVVLMLVLLLKPGGLFGKEST